MQRREALHCKMSDPTPMPLLSYLAAPHVLPLWRTLDLTGSTHQAFGFGNLKLFHTKRSATFPNACSRLIRKRATTNGNEIFRIQIPPESSLTEQCR
jgi:hypothetical protein